jgi:hypothetical protein
MRTYKETGLRVNNLKDNIEMNIKKMVFMIIGLNMINIQFSDHSYQPRYLSENDEYLAQLI